jgi:hypothetical protein
LLTYPPPAGVSHRPTPTSQARRLSSDSSSRSPHREPHSSLAALLFNLNTSAVSSISATINGSARLVPRGSDEERYYRDIHLENNTFDNAADPGIVFGPGGAEGEAEAGEEAGSRFAPGDEAMVIVVGINDVRIADRKGAVRDWVIAEPGAAPVVNGMP